MFEELPVGCDDGAPGRVRAFLRRYLVDPLFVLADLLDRRSVERLF